MKKALKILLAILICMSIVGCSSNSSSNKKPSKKTNEDEEKMDKKDDIIRIGFIGDSITYGTNSSNPQTKSYPAVLQRLLGDKYEIKNFGWGGSCAISDKDPNNMYSKMDKYYRNGQQYKDSLEYDADIMIIMLGTNDRTSVYSNDCKLLPDGLESYKFWLEDIGQEYSAKGIKVYIASSIYSPVSNKAPREYLDGMLQGFQKEVADSNGWQFIDVYSYTRESFEGFDNFSSDHLHPNDQGYELIAQGFYQYISKNITSK